MGLRIRKRPFAVLFLFFALLFILAGCDPETRYRALNFFFDGVPRPGEPPKKEEIPAAKIASVKQEAQAETPSEIVYYRHPPAEGKDDCSFCHGPVSQIVIPPKDMCLKCHEHLKENRPFLHGPAVVDCVFCHNVHRSQTKTLLRKTGNLLCFECHDQQSVIQGESHRELKEEEFVCLSCHDPHGGKDRFFLR